MSSDLGEERSAKRGVVSVSFLDETDGLGGLKDKLATSPYPIFTLSVQYL